MRQEVLVPVDLMSVLSTYVHCCEGLQSPFQASPLKLQVAWVSRSQYTSDSRGCKLVTELKLVECVITMFTQWGLIITLVCVIRGDKILDKTRINVRLLAVRVCMLQR